MLKVVLSPSPGPALWRQAMLQFAICDDEPLMVRELADRLADYMKKRPGALYRVSRFSSGRALLESGGGFDVIFLDIQMERPDGMETAKALRRRGEAGLLIFVTVLRECVFDAFEVEALDYLVKPLEAGRFGRTLDRALRLLERRAAKTLVVRRGAACEVVSLAGLVYCEVQGRKIYFHKSDGTVVDGYERMEALEHAVDSRFFRCHRSYLVNLDHVRGCQAGQVLLTGDGRIPVSRLRERDLTQALLRHMKERDL